MPKIIAPSFPIEEIRGKLAGSQKLEYAENNNPAYDSPLGKRNYARNYKTCIIACKRASDGKQYFQIKTKSAIGMTAKSKKRMAILGGAGAVYNVVVADGGKHGQPLYGALHGTEEIGPQPFVGSVLNHVAAVEQESGIGGPLQTVLQRGGNASESGFVLGLGVG